MLSQKFHSYVSQIQQCAKQLLEAEAHSLNTSIWSLFNKRDHKNSIVTIDACRAQLTKMKKEIERGSIDPRESIRLQDYINSLSSFGETLKAICCGLEKKKNGEQYSMTIYQQSINLLEQQKQMCAATQQNLYK